MRKIVPLPLSVIVLTFNEEKNIEACLSSLYGWIDEIIVVDSGSTDQTIEIAERYTDKILQHPFENYAAQRNWAQCHSMVTHDWVFHVDADERVTPELRGTLEEFFTNENIDAVNGFLIVRRTVFMGRWISHGGHYPSYHLRVFRRENGACEDRLYDQHFIVEGPLIQVKGDLVDVITTDLDRWIMRHVRWAGLEAQEQLNKAGKQESKQTVRAHLTGTPIEHKRWLRKSIYERMPLFIRVFAYFTYRYVLRLGFLDGVQGLVFHFLQGFWYRFYIDAKIWEFHYMHREQHDQ
ncbi:MAG: glycosyltransferase family 2 protein [Aggregatilineales bacterium]